ncbi:MAG: radical SAM family heme chaperone HemW [Lachnospiraceae bacterium]|nr:radical SAM family heme chaperone HemW [Lachnospiraceae bacterium]
MDKRIELYIHIPFCVKKCKYCDFLSMPAEEYIQDMYIRQLIEEIKVQSQFYQDYVVSTIFFGGGTPSILKSVHITNIMSAVYAHWRVEASAEISLEANPGTLSQERLLNYKAAGINRLSIGLQSANDSELKVLGRIHTFADFLESYENARTAGFSNINVDLISAIPGQTLSGWKNTVKRTAMLKPEHISAYSLIIEEGTEFHDLYSTKIGKKLLPDEETDRAMYHATNDILEIYGYKRYEISNFARPGYECRHNIGYWTGTEYLGLGLGASSYTMGRRFHVERDLDNYLHMNMNKDITPLYEDIQELTPEEKMGEFMILGLRMTQGVSAAEFHDRFGMNMMEKYAEEIEKHVRQGLLDIDMPYVRLTEKGLDLANVVMQDFI